MHLEINRVGGQREFAKIEQRFDLSMESKMYGNPKENHAMRDQSGLGTARIRKTEHRFDLSMESKMYKNPKENLHLGINRAGGQREFAKK